MEAVAPPQSAVARLSAPFKVRDFRLLWGGATLSALGDNASFIALSWLALQLTGSPLSLGLVLMTAAIPRGVLMLVGGALVDRHSPRAAMMVSGSGRALAMGLLAALTFSHAIQLWDLLALAFVFGTLDSIYYPALTSVLPGILPGETLQSGNAVQSSSVSVAGIAGPALGGVLVAAAGPAPAFAIDAVCFAILALAAAAMTPRRREVAAGADPDPKGILGSIREGAAYVWHDAGIATVLAISAVLNFAVAGPYNVGLAALSRERLGGAFAFGVMAAAFAGGTLLGTVAAGAAGNRQRIGHLLIGFCFALGAATVFLGLVPNLAAGAALAIGIGLPVGFVNVVGLTWLQRRATPELMGRVMSLMMLAGVGVAPVSYAISGAVAAAHLLALFVLGGALLGATGVVAASLRAVREM